MLHMTDNDAQAEAGKEYRSTEGNSAARAALYSPSLIVFILGVAMAAMSVQLGVGTLRTPGAGYWPFVVSIILALAAATMGINTYRHRPGSIDVEEEPDDDHDHGRSWLGLAVVLGIGVLFTTVGFLLSMVAGLFVWLKFVAGESWRLTIVLTAGISAAVYLLFAELLGVRFPPGILSGMFIGGI